MEDSFNDFKKKKKIKTGPKVDPKDKRNNKKKSQRSKGQKDIRSLIKKNELASYTQDFEEVCKQSGIDVDAEQLQLAIALSKSINKFQLSSEDVEIQNKQLSSQERSAKIRNTLQEYGFKVNNSKILLSLSTNKRRKYNKHSKLLKISSEEREQKISNKYSQVLASNICKSTNEEPKCIYLKHTIFYKASNISYNSIKNDDAYYVSNLIDKPTHKTCLLRDWSEIPGRPVSPKPKHNDINFKSIQYSQDELDNILSGSVDTAQSIVNSKQYIKEDPSLIDNLPTCKDCSSIEIDTIDLIEPIPSCSNNLKYNENQVPQMSDTKEIPKIQVDDIQVSEKCSSIKDKENVECIDLIEDISFKDCSKTSFKVIDSQSLNSRPFRSTSPDLFDDEACSIIEDKNNCSTIEINEAFSIIEDKNKCSTIEINEAFSIIEDKNKCSTIEINEAFSIIEDKNKCSTIEINEAFSIIEDKNKCSTIEINEAFSIIEDKNKCSTIEINEAFSIIEDKNNCSTIEINEAFSIIEDKNKCSTIEINEAFSIIEDKNKCSTIEINEAFSIIEDKNKCSTIEINEAFSIIEDKNKCSTIEINEAFSIIEDKNNCSTIEINEAFSIIEDKNNCSTIEINEAFSIIEDKNKCSTIEINEAFSIIEDKNKCSTIEINEVCSIIEDKNHNGTKERKSKKDNCGTFFMDLTECTNNIYSYSNIYNTDKTKRNSNDLMDITECVKPDNNNVDIILSSGETNDENKEEKNVELVDLTQFSHSAHHSPEIDKSTKESNYLDTDDTVIYDNVFTNKINKSIDLQEPIELCAEESMTKDIISDKNSIESDNFNNSDHNSCKDDEENDIISQKSIENMECENNNYDINIDLTQGLNYPEFIYENYTSETSENSCTNNDKDNDVISLKSVSFDNYIENQDEDIDLTQNSDKSFDIVQENYVRNGPGTSYNNNSDLENLDVNVGTIDNKNNSIISVESIVVNSNPFDNNDDKVDLTQGTEEIDEKIETGYSYVHKNNSKLGKINNISINYDEMFDEITSECRNVSNHLKNNSEKDDVNGSNPSINSEVFEISDKELNYSIHHSIHENINMDFERTARFSLNRCLSDGNVRTDNLSKPLSPIKEKKYFHPNTPIKINRHIQEAIIQTPKNSEYIIKTREVTPMADYESMTSPERNEELEKYGLKPFKRKRAIQLLTYVYNQTHPIIQSCSPEEGPSKRLKTDIKYTSPKKKSRSPKKCLDFGSDVNKENDIFLVTNETPDIKNVECDPKEWVFQNREKAKVHSCRVPLHIAFHNYVSCRKLLREAILRYEPVNLDIIHRDLVSYGHKYNPKDILKFMDKRCITVKTVENNSRNKKV